MQFINLNKPTAIPRARGILKTDKGFVAITFREAKTFSSLKKAQRWMEKQGYSINGERLGFTI